MEKETVKIVIIGHLDHGKSTLIGRLLLDTNSLPNEKIEEIKIISNELGKDTELAYLTDQLKEERQRGISIDTTQVFFKTKKGRYCIIDTPGHVEFLKNMITGASLAEAAVLMVDIKEGIMEQTCRHAYLINMLGIKKLIVVFNKMDLAGYSEDRFKKLKGELLEFLKNLKIKPDLIVPVSAKQRINISRRSPKMAWYKGPDLLAALDSLISMTKTDKKPLRFPVQDVYRIDGKDIIVGKISSGAIRQGQKIVLCPSMEEAKVKSIETFARHKKKAMRGESIGITLNRPLSVKRGEIVCQRQALLRPIYRFKVSLFWISSYPLIINKTIALRCATQEVKCITERIEKRIDSSTLEIIEEGSDQLRLNEAGIVIFRAERPILIEDFNFIEDLGRFVVERDHDLQGAGIIRGPIKNT